MLFSLIEYYLVFLLFDSGAIVHTFDRHTARIWQTNLRNVINQIVRIQTNTKPEAHSKYSQEFMNLFFFSARCLTKDFANVTNPIVIHISEIGREKDRIFISFSARTRTAQPHSSQKGNPPYAKHRNPGFDRKRFSWQIHSSIRFRKIRPNA